MTQPRIHRFDFNSLRDFRGPIAMKATNEPLVVDLPPPPPPPVFNEAELEAARHEAKKQGYADGFIAGQKEAQLQADQKIEHANEVIAQLAASVAEMNARYLALLSEESAQLSKLVMAIAQKVVGSSLEEKGAEAICNIVTQCLPVIFSKPKLVIEMNPTMFDSTIDVIETKLQTHGFEGEIQFKGNPTLGVSDVVLDWGTGQMERKAETLWNEVESLIDRMPLARELTEAALPTDIELNETPTGE